MGKNLIAFFYLWNIPNEKLKGEKIMTKQIIKLPAYTTRGHASEQTQKAQRMGSRYFVDKKKESKKYVCRKEN